jgi:hypothetical protein
MQLGIIGLPQSGKTTIFNALTHGNQPLTSSRGRFEIHTAVVDVPDVRMERLIALFQPKKTVYARVTYTDIAGLEGGKATISGPLLNQLSQMESLLHVVRCFDSTNIPHPDGSIDPLRDLAAMDTELILNDLILVERKLERLDQERLKGGGREKALVEREAELFTRFHQALSTEIPLRALQVSVEERKLISGYGFLSIKPVLVVFNLAEGQPAPAYHSPHPLTEVISLQGKLEMDLAQLPSDEAAIFMEEYGIHESSLDLVDRLAYQLLGLISFYTVGPDEVHAWALPHGETAYDAAGVIHSDLQKGFIRAEVIANETLLELGGLNQAKVKGKLRLEGRDYIVQDGEIVHIRFNL